jgi:hypothetical protein
MYFITMIIGIIVGLAAIFVISRCTKNVTIISGITFLIIVVAMSLSKVYVVTYATAATYEYFLKKDDPVCRLIAITYPNQFKTFIENIKQVIRQNKGKDIQFFYKTQLLNAIFLITVPKATNATLYDYYQSELALYQALYQLDPNLVLFMEFSTKYAKKLDPGLALLLSGEDKVKDVTEKKEAVIASGIKTPQPLITSTDKARAADLIHDILNKLAIQFGDQAMSSITTDPSKVTISSSKAAAFIVAFYQNILNLDKDDVGIIFKYLFNGQSPSENRDETHKNPT